MKQVLARVYHNRNIDTGALIIRLAIGIIFVSAAWMKMSDMAATVGFFTQMGFSASQAYLVAWVEMIGGILLILGLFIKPASVALAVIMAVVVWGTPGNQYDVFFGHNYQFILLVTLIALYFIGAGRFSALFLRKKGAN